MTGGADLLQFPCDFPIKVMGRTQDGFAQAIVTVVQKHAPDFEPSTISSSSWSRGFGTRMRRGRGAGRRPNDSIGARRSPTRRVTRTW